MGWSDYSALAAVVVAATVVEDSSGPIRDRTSLAAAVAEEVVARYRYRLVVEQIGGCSSS